MQQVFSKEEIDQFVLEARARIEKALNQNGQYTHNMLSIALRTLADKVGCCVANQLISEYELDYLYDIHGEELNAAILLTSNDPLEREQGALETIYAYYKVND